MENYFWGPDDSSVHFCEKKYENISWIAEYHNTLSSIFYLITGLLLIKAKKKRLGWGMIFVGIGAAMLHMTLRYYAQWFDEIAMMGVCFFGLKEVKKNLSDLFFFPLLIAYGMFNQYFIYFFIFFAGTQIYMAYESIKMFNKKNFPLKRKISVILYIMFFLMGTICWFCDQFLCNYVQNMQLHAWWHLFTALGSFFGFYSLVI